MNTTLFLMAEVAFLFLKVGETLSSQEKETNHEISYTSQFVSRASSVSPLVMLLKQAVKRNATRMCKAHHQGRQ